MTTMNNQDPNRVAFMQLWNEKWLPRAREASDPINAFAGKWLLSEMKAIAYQAYQAGVDAGKKGEK